MLAATLLTLGVVFVAELGDRSQLITMTYALRYRWWVVLAGVALAAFTVHGVSVTVGHFLGAALPARPLAFASALAFLVFAVWAWREGTATDEAVSRPREPRFAFLAVVSSFALAEVSDKTALATVTLASEHDWIGVWIGSTVGMVLADGLAIAAGRLLHLLFVAFGLWILFDSALGWRGVAVAATLAVAIVAVVSAAAQTLRRRRTVAAIGAGRPRTG
jgi:putative Ca2+/H+ antiporter (TMEM165/GDT1 family)